MGSSSFHVGGPSPQSFQRAMVFADGTNLFRRLESARVKVPRLYDLWTGAVGGRQIVRAYCYTVKQHLVTAKEVHGDSFLDGIRVVFGDEIRKENGTIKEKCVDALLVADMIYHAASKNCDYILLVSADTDFRYALRRVEDFGCRTGLMSVCCQAPERLRQACDEYHERDINWLVSSNIASAL